MMGGKANAFKILELSPFLPNARLAICRKERNMDRNLRTAMQKRWCSIWASDLSKEKRVLAQVAKISLGPCSQSRKNTFIGRSSESHPHFSCVLPCFTNGCESGPGQNALSDIFFYGNPSLPHPPGAVVVDMCMRLAAQYFETSV